MLDKQRETRRGSHHGQRIAQPGIELFAGGPADRLDLIWRLLVCRPTRRMLAVFIVILEYLRERDALRAAHECRAGGRRRYAMPVCIALWWSPQGAELVHAIAGVVSRLPW